MNRFSALLVRTAIVVAFTVVATTASAAWDQQGATKLAQQLPEAMEKLYTALQLQPPAAGGGEAYHEFKDRVRLMRSECMHLASELKQGKGQAETKHAFQRIKELNDDAKEYAQQQFSGGSVTSEFSTVEGLLDQLAAFY
jgi:hypothetical protein